MSLPASYKVADVWQESDAEKPGRLQSAHLQGVKDDGLASPKAASFIRGFMLLAALPNQALLILFLEFLNSFKGHGLRQVQMQYLTSEFHMSDEKAGELIGFKATLDVIFGFAGSFLTDIFGVRLTSLAGMAAGVCGRFLIAFGRTEHSLQMAYLLFSPFGEAILYTGLYKVALKKVTTPRTRAFAFSLSYAVSNLGGAVSDVLIDTLRVLPDLQFKLGDTLLVFTSIRIFLVLTWCTTVFMLFMAVCLLRNETIVDEADLESVPTCELQVLSTKVIAPAERTSRLRFASDILLSTEASTDLRHLQPTARAGLSGLWQAFVLERRQRLRSYRAVPTELWAAGDMKREDAEYATSGRAVAAGFAAGARDVLKVLQLRELWTVMAFSFCSFPVAAQWAATSILMPVYLERSFGESVPIFTILSINFWGCVILPPIVAVTTIHLETFRIVMPGLWIMGLSPLLIAAKPSIAGAVLWQVFLTIGEVLWSPRVVAWAASLAPVGREGVFLAFASAREALTPVLDVLYGYLAQSFVPNCRHLGCRDNYGHFCGLSGAERRSCSSFLDGPPCEVVPNETSVTWISCPNSCQECPGWESDPVTLWAIVAGISAAGPVMAWILLPFLQGGSAHGVLHCGAMRLQGICGCDHD